MSSKVTALSTRWRLLLHAFSLSGEENPPGGDRGYAPSYLPHPQVMAFSSISARVWPVTKVLFFTLACLLVFFLNYDTLKSYSEPNVELSFFFFSLSLSYILLGNFSKAENICTEIRYLRYRNLNIIGKSVASPCSHESDFWDPLSFFVSVTSAILLGKVTASFSLWPATRCHWWIHKRSALLQENRSLCVTVA